MKQIKIDLYSIMITSKYFESIDDFINLELSSKRFQGNMERFHFNPITLTKQTKQFFSSLQTLHLYEEDDEEFLEDNKIIKRIYWYTIDYERMKQMDSNKNECKSIYYKGISDETRQIIIPDGVSIINSMTFPEETEYITIPKSVKIMEYDSLLHCQQLTNIKISSDWELKGNRLFNFNNNQMISLQIPSTVKTVNRQRISLSELQEITIPSNITSIHYDCFENCNELQHLTIKNGWKLNVNCIVNNQSHFIACKIPESIISINSEKIKIVDLQTFTIPSFVTSLSNNCFYQCISFKSIIIPNKIKRIGDYCFAHCQSLESIYLPDSLISLGIGTFSNCNNLTSIHLSSSIKQLPQSTFYYCHSLESIIIPNSVTSLGRNCFIGCSSIKEIHLSNSIKAIGKGCFKLCLSLTNIELPTSLEYISLKCFS